MNSSISPAAPLWQRLAPVAQALATHRQASVADLDVAARAHLQDVGVAVEGDLAHLDDDVQLLTAAPVRAALDPQTQTWLRRLDIVPCIDSTNSALLAQAASERIDGCVLTAEVQVAGRGRRGRTWLSPFGRNLAISVGLRSARPAAEVGALSLVVGVAVRRALQRYGLSGVELKWPNDVLLDGRKVAGVLIELVRATAPVEVVVGIGINVGCGESIAARVDQSVADVAEQIEAPSRNALLAAVLDALVAAAARFEQAGFAPFQAEWQAAHRFHGAAVTIAPPPPAEAISGVVLGVAGNGALRVETDGGVQECHAGEVTLREATAQ